MPKDHESDSSPGDATWRFSGFAIPTTTPVPDQLFDELMSRLPPAELVVTLYIVRRTFGFKKPSDRISLRQLTDGIVTRDGRTLDGGTGLSKATVARALNSLEQKGVIVRARNRSEQHGDEPTTYQLNFLATVSHSETPPLSQIETPRVSHTRQAVSHQRDTQQTVLQDTVSSNSSNPDISNSQGLTASKFRKASSPIEEKGRVSTEKTAKLPDPSQRPSAASVSAAAGTASDRGLAHIRDVLARASIAPRPRPDGTRAQANPRGLQQPAVQPRPSSRAQPVSESEAAGIRAYLGDYAPELGDKAPFKSSMTRVTNIYLESGMTVAAFTARMDSARRRTKATPKLRNKFSYWLALLEEECGLREAPPERAERARRRGSQQQVADLTAPTPAERTSLAGKYAHLVRR